LSRPFASVALVTRDGAATLPGLLAALARQRTDFPFEVVAIDSGSTDGTPDLLAGRVDRLERIAPSDFDHGRTRNLAVEIARGELVVFLVQDAEPVGDRWLHELAAPLVAHADVAGSFARQLPRPEASALARFALARWFAGGEEPRLTEPMTAEAFDRLDPMRRMDLSTFDNVCSCLRRTVWERQPFAPTPMAEDLEWGRDALRAGHRLAFAPAAAVVHSHDRGLRYELARTYQLHRRLHGLFGFRSIPSARHLASAVARTLPLHARLALADRRRPRLALRTLGLAFVWPLGQYLGGRRGAREAARR
jgi:rhamnosyltransferase